MPPCVFSVATPLGPPTVVWQITWEHNFIAMSQQRQQRQPVRLRACMGFEGCQVQNGPYRQFRRSNFAKIRQTQCSKYIFL